MLLFIIKFPIFYNKLNPNIINVLFKFFYSIFHSKYHSNALQSNKYTVKT